MENNEVGLICLRRFRTELDIVPSTAWRWIQRGWLDKPINIGGRPYLTMETIRRFKERAGHGEFAGSNKPPGRKITLD
jgi:Zn-finger nucleic acid-binding protein